MKKEITDMQYTLLKECSEKGDFSEWNDYAENTTDLIDFRGSTLDNIKIVKAVFINKNSKGANFCDASLKGASLQGVDMSGCYFLNANLTGINASGSVFHEATFSRAKADSAVFALCDFNQARFQDTVLCSVKFISCKFQECTFFAADLSDAKFYGGGYNPLLGCEQRLNLCGTSFLNAKFTSNTYFHLADVSRETDFRTISFENACYSAGLRQSLQYCNRRHNWNDWYKKNSKIKGFFVNAFWTASDYGRSPWRVICSFFIICFFYACLYTAIPSLTSDDNLDLIRGFYFSVSTMTTLGFGDIHANELSWISQILLTTHVLAGYILLGALLTVLSNLFTADGPPQGLIKHPVNKKDKFRVHMKNTE